MPLSCMDNLKILSERSQNSKSIVDQRRSQQQILQIVQMLGHNSIDAPKGKAGQCQRLNPELFGRLDDCLLIRSLENTKCVLIAELIQPSCHFIITSF